MTTETFVCECGKSFEAEKKRRAHRLHCKVYKQTLPPKEEPGENTGDDSKKTKQRFKSLSNDIQWMYVQMGGREKLLDEATKDSRFFKMLVETMLRAEQRVEDTKPKGGDQQGNTYFVIKGLYSDTNEKNKELVDIEIKRFQAGVMPDKEEFAEEVLEDKDAE